MFDHLTNENLIDLMHHALKRYEKVQHPFTPKSAVWVKWIRL